MKSVLIKLSFVFVFAGILWTYVGVERMVGDHEVGVTWEPFIKHRPSLQVRFINPSRSGLEIVPFDELSPAEQVAFVEFCTIRFGMTDVAQCHALISKRGV